MQVECHDQITLWQRREVLLRVIQEGRQIIWYFEDTIQVLAKIKRWRSAAGTVLADITHITQVVQEGKR
jgi:DNA-binding transcriptional MerR regulator